jgi:predicted N-formylglutamate amidohydrolase
MAVVVTCEHASKHVPARYRSLFAGHERLLESHRGYDKGALPLSRAIARALGADAMFGRNSRLLIDLNRSLSHPGLLSRFTKVLSAEEKQALVDQCYRPFRESVQRRIAWHLAAGRPVLHLCVHSFTPVLCGRRRNADVGLLYDPARTSERELALSLGRALSERGLVVRRNYPYRGTADGHTTALRRAFPDGYTSLELELNQRLTGDAARFSGVRREIAGALCEVLDEPGR